VSDASVRPRRSPASGTACDLLLERSMGGHSTTGKHRPKRGDFRLTAKQRYAQSKKWEDAKAASDLRVVKIKKSQRKERVVDASAMRLKKPKLTPVQKKVKALEKKLVDIGKLRERKEAGEELDENQLTKLASEEDVKEDLAACKLHPGAIPKSVSTARCRFVHEQADSLLLGTRIWRGQGPKRCRQGARSAVSRAGCVCPPLLCRWDDHCIKSKHDLFVQAYVAGNCAAPARAPH
jgi:hypothetical protein